jgi:cell division protein FtsB
LKKKRVLQFPFTQFVAIVVITVCLFLVIDFGRRTAANYQIRAEETRLETELTDSQSRHTALQARLAYVQSDAYVEEIARTQLKWAREGETVVVVMATPQASPQAPADGQPSAINGVVPETPWQAWWLLFFGILPPI